MAKIQFVKCAGCGHVNDLTGPYAAQGDQIVCGYCSARSVLASRGRVLRAGPTTEWPDELAAGEPGPYLWEGVYEG